MLLPRSAGTYDDDPVPEDDLRTINRDRTAEINSPAGLAELVAGGMIRLSNSAADDGVVLHPDAGSERSPGILGLLMGDIVLV